jgi:thiol-disulfide isomerase/thioredoxin
MNKLLRILLVLLTIATGALFLYSAYTKLFPTIQTFEYTIVEFTHTPLMIAKLAARFFIGLEAGLGALMILHFFGKRNWVLKSAMALMVLFSLFLVFLWATAGNDVNCGCFGDAIWMKPSVSLLKNAAIMGILWLLLRYAKGFRYKWAQITAPLLLVATLTTGYIVFPVYDIYKMNLRPIYADKKWAPVTDLTKGKHIVAFLSPSCGHCRKAAIKMQLMKQHNPKLPFYMIIGGVESDLTSFWQDTKAVSIPYTRLNRDEFMKYTKGVFPQIFWLNNSMVEDNTGYPELDQQLIEKWMK